MSVAESDLPQTHSRVLFFDDFSSGSLDRSKWNVRITGSIYNVEQQAYVDSSETIYVASSEEIPGAHYGVLVFHPRYRPDHTTPEGHRFDFISGRIDTRDKFDFRYGSAAARIMLPSGPGLWPAFWLLGYGKWPGSGEIDVLEYVGEPDWGSAAVHGPGYFGEAGLVNKHFFSSSDDATTWHVYSVDWHPDTLLFKVDGRTMYRVTRQMTDFFGPLIYLASNPNLYPITVGLNGFKGLYEGQDNLIQAAALTAALIPLVVFFFAQRAFMQGVVITGVEK
jgi:beta-glucanase (GH16 family)